MNSPSKKRYAQTSLALLIITIIAIIIANGYLLLIAHPLPFYEPDNYEYLIFVQQALIQHSIAISNPYLVHTYVGFFEHPGLYQLPYVLSEFSGLGAIVSMHLIYVGFLLLLYTLILIVVKRITQSILLNHFERYFIFAITILSPMLLPYNYAIEWRGTLFIAVAELVGILLLDNLSKSPSKVWKMYYVFGIVGAIAFSIWMWSGGYATPFVLVGVLLGYLIYKIVPFKITILVTLGLTLIFLVLAFEPAVLGPIFVHILGFACTSNPLHLAEAVCLNQTSSVGLVAVALLFSFIALLILIAPRTIYNTTKKNEFLLVALFSAIAIQLPLVIIYFRLLAIVAPELAIMFAVGLVMLSKYFQTKAMVEFLVLSAVVIMLLFTLISNYLSTAAFYHIYNPIGLYKVAAFLNATYPNSTVFTFFGYGDVLEAYGHVRTYSDTIQQLAYGNTSLILALQPREACQSLAALRPKPQFVLLSKQLINYSTFLNASKSSLLYAKKVACLMQIWQRDNFTLYKFNSSAG